MYDVEDCGVGQALEVFRAMRCFDAREYIRSKEFLLCEYMEHFGLDVCLVPMDGSLGSLVAAAFIRNVCGRVGSSVCEVELVSMGGGPAMDLAGMLSAEFLKKFGQAISFAEAFGYVSRFLVRGHERRYARLGMKPLVLIGRTLDDMPCQNYGGVNLFSDIYYSELKAVAEYLGVVLPAESDEMPCSHGLLEFYQEMSRLGDSGKDLVEGLLDMDMVNYAVVLPVLKGLPVMEFDRRLALWDVRASGGWDVDSQFGRGFWEGGRVAC